MNKTISRFKVALNNIRTFETVDDWVDEETFESEEEALAYISEIGDSMAEGEEILRLRGEWDDEAEPAYGYGDDDLVLGVEIID